jgi:pyruvate dehydrogenase E2 component (dihydrolipoamide acetyltransferase)
MAIEILMPALSPTMEEGKLAKWHVKEGDKVRSGDVIAEIETDKATMEVEAVDEGTIGRLLIAEGTEGVAVNKPIATLLEEGEKADAAPAPKKAEAPKKEATKQDTPHPMPAASISPSKGEVIRSNTSSRVFASPLAKRIAADKGVDLAQIKGSGPHGRIVKADVEQAKGGGVAAPRAATQSSEPGSGIDPRAYYEKDSYIEVPLDGMRKTIARRLTQAKQQIPHYYLTVDCELDELMAVRKQLNESQAEQGVKLSVNDFVIRAAALALVKVPEANASFAGNALLMHKHADIGIAVALEGGLITPLIRHAESKGLAEISAEAKSLAERAKAKKLKPSEYEGGSFSISNLGMFGIKNFTAVINPPQAAILAVGRGEERAVVKKGKLEIATVMTVTLSCDHRVIDGALGARLLEAFKAYIEYPPSMLL